MLRSSALLALCKLMCLDAGFCDTNLQLVFTLLQNRQRPQHHYYRTPPFIQRMPSAFMPEPCLHLACSGLMLVSRQSLLALARRDAEL